MYISILLKEHGPDFTAAELGKTRQDFILGCDISLSNSYLLF